MSSTTISERTLQDRPSYTRRSPQERVGLVQFPFRHHPYHQKPASDQYTHTRRYTSKHHQRRTPSYESAPLLTRLSNSSSPRSPTNTLLDRIGAQAISVEEEEEGAINSEDDVQATLQPRLDTPEPGELEREDHEPVVVEPDEVDRFLESVIGPPPPRVPDMSPSVGRLTSHTPCLLMDNTFKVEETRRLYDWVSEGSEECPPGLMYIKQESTTHSPLPPFMAGAEADNPRISTHTSLSRSSSMPTPHPHDHVAPTAPRLSTTVLEQCREHLAPVVQAASVAGAARDTHSRPPQCTTHADAQQCTTTFRLSDDQCTALHCLAKDMRAQLHHHHASAREQKTNGRESSESAEPWGRRTDLGSHPDHRTPWSRRRDLSARHESVDTPFRRDSDMTLVDVPSSKDASSVLMKGSVGVEKHYDSLPKEERMSPALSTTDAFNNGIVDRPESIFRCLDLEETATPVCPPVPEVQGFTGHGIWSKHDGSDMPDVHDVEITVGEKLFSPEIAR